MKLFILWEMLTNIFGTMVNNLFKEIFMGKEKKKVINVLTVFFSFPVKTFLK